MKKKVLFVCTGNTCRSPMAEGIMRDRVRAEQLNGLMQCSSAGTYAFGGEPASVNSYKAALEHGIDLRSHQSKRLTAAQVQEADLILTMTENQRRDIVLHYPQAACKVFSLSEYVSDNGQEDIIDPFGMDLEAYQKTYQQLDAYISLLINQLKGDSI